MVGIDEKYRIIKIVKIALILVTILNGLICIIEELRYIEFLYPLIFIGLNIYVMFYKRHIEIILNNDLTYTMKKKYLKFRRILPLGAIILAAFFICKEPYFFLSKSKTLFLVISLTVEFLIIILQRIKIKLRLSFL